MSTNPEQARSLLTVNPQLCYALFQAMLMMNIVDPSVLQRMIVPGSQGSHNVVLPLQPLQQNAGGPPPPFPPQQLNQFGGGYNGGIPPPVQSMPSQPVGYPPLPGNFPMPPQGQQPVPPQSQYGRPPVPVNNFPPQQAAFPPQNTFTMAPHQQAGYGTPPPAQAQTAAQMQANPQQQALLQQVLSMSQQQIDLLPPDQRNTVMAIVRSLRF